MLALSLLVSGGLVPAGAQTYVDADGEISTSGGTVDCDGTDTTVETSVSAALSNGATDINVCGATYSSSAALFVIDTDGISVAPVSGSGDVIFEANAADTASVEIDASNVSIRGLSINHKGGGPSDASNTVEVLGGNAVTLDGLTITRSALTNTNAAIKPGGTDLTIKNCDLTGGPIGGGAGDVYRVENNVIRGTGDEGIWMTGTDSVYVLNNAVERTADGNDADDRKGIAVYGASAFLKMEGNNVQVDGAAYLLGNDIPILHNGTVNTLQTAADMRAVLGRNMVEGSSPGRISFVAESDGTLRTNADGVHIVRTGITNVPGAGGAGAYQKSALGVATDGNVIHLAAGATYSEHIRLTSSPSEPSQAKHGVAFSTPTSAILDTLALDGVYTVDVASGTITIGDSLFTGAGSSLTGSSLTLDTDAVLEDKGLTSGRIEATRAVSAGTVESFGNLGLKMTVDGSSADLGETTVTRVDGTPVMDGKGSIERYYDVSAATESGLDVTLTMEYDDGDDGDNELDAQSLTEADLQLFRSEDQGRTWTELAAQLDQSADTLRTVSSLTEFSRFTAAETGSALPVELSRFDANTDGDQVELRWTTAVENDNAGFTIQRVVRMDGSDGTYENIGFVDGHGTTSSPRRYSFEDQEYPYQAEALVYRLKQIDQTGGTTLSDPVTVKLDPPSQSRLFGSVSNPVRGDATIRFELARSAEVRLSVFNALGQRVARLVDGQQDAGRQSVRFTTSGLPSGIYFIRLQTNGETQSKRMTIVR